MARDYKIIKDPATGKRGLSLVNGTLETVVGAEEAAQRVETALNMILGEWVFDLLAGLPLFDQIFRRAQYTNLITGYYRQAILGVSGIKSVEALTLERETSERNYKLTFSAFYEDDTLIEGKV